MNKLFLHATLTICTLAAAALVSAMVFFLPRWVSETASVLPRETNAALDTPDRGYYNIHGFTISDSMNCARELSDSYMYDTDTELTLVEFNLKNYSGGDISAKGLQNIETLFDGLRAMDRRCIVRFLYDWQGKAKETEPEDTATVLRHMEQLGDIVRRNSDMIFTLQGVFTGDCGEMHGTVHNDWKTLVEELSVAVGEDVYLAVRTPRQWRGIVAEDAAKDSGLAARLGLFNDGMMGSESDLGTYGEPRREDADYDAAWCREDELAFQEELCRAVPNGGEVVFDTEYNDFENALDNLRTMHISYLNAGYDPKALDKWERYRVREPGIWNGMDGLTYIGRHLGYRFVLRDTSVTYRFKENRLCVAVGIANEGFAPAYRDVGAEIILVNDESGESSIFPLNGDLRTLSGGRESDKTLTLQTNIPAGELPRGSYTVYLRLISEGWGREIPLGNAGGGEHGYKIGTITPKKAIWA